MYKKKKKTSSTTMSKSIIVRDIQFMHALYRMRKPVWRASMKTKYIEVSP